MKEIAKDFPHYAVLIGMFAFGFVGFLAFSYDLNFEYALAVALALGYFTWGVVHHAIHKDLYVSVVLEYLMISLLGLVILLTILFRI